MSGVIFDIFRAYRKCTGKKSGIVAMQDILFWLFELVLVYATAFKVNNAGIHGYEAIALVLGSVVYFSSVSALVIKLFCVFWRAVIAAVSAVLSPVRRIKRYLKIKFFSVLKRALAALAKNFGTFEKNIRNLPKRIPIKFRRQKNKTIKKPDNI